MTDKDLTAFKAGDRQKKRVSAAARPEDGDGEARATMGFARIEHILDATAPGEANARLQELIAGVTTREEAAKTAKERSACKRARAALERTMDLLDHLFATKASMQTAIDAPGGAR